VRNGLQGEDGPFEIHQPVLPAAARPRPGQRAPIRPHHQGYYFDTREQVEIIRAAREALRGERDVTAGQPQAEEADDG
jgi:hypothetical protein